MQDKAADKSEAPSDQLVLSAIQSGKSSDFSYIVERYQGKIYALIMRQTSDQHLSEELTQETFVKAFKGIKNFRAESALLTWLTRIALNITNSYFDSRRFKERRASIEFDSTKHEAHIEAVSDNKYPEELILQLQQFLGDLKSHHREVVVLCALEGKSYKEAADILQIPIGTVSSRMTMALKQLREKFQRIVL